MTTTAPELPMNEAPLGSVDCSGSASVDSRVRADAPRIAVIGNTDIVKFRGWLIEDLVREGSVVFACSPSLKAADIERLDKAGATYRPIELAQTGINPLQDLLHLARLTALLRQLPVDMVVAHTTKAMVIGCLAARLAKVRKTFAIVEGLGYAFGQAPQYKRRVLRAILVPAMKAALSSCDGVFVLNSADRDDLVALGVLSAQQPVLQIAGTGIDLTYFRYVPASPGPPRFLLIARMIRDKGIREFVDAARIVKRERPDAVFRMLGPVENHPAAISEAEIGRFEAEGLIQYCGVTDDVRPYLAECTVFVLPTYYREGLPRTIIEAMAVGRPVVATDIPGCRAAVTPGVTGLLVPPRDVEALAAALLSMCSASHQCLGKNARRHAETKFGVRSVNARIMSVLFSAP